MENIDPTFLAKSQAEVAQVEKAEATEKAEVVSETTKALNKLRSDILADLNNDSKV